MRYLLASKVRRNRGTVGLLGLVVALALLPIMSAAAIGGEDYPARPIRLIVPFPPGGSTDTLARIVGYTMAAELGQAVFIDNRGGGGGIIGTDFVAHSNADGYTVLLGYGANFTIDPTLYRKLPFDPLNSFTPVTELATTANVLVVHPSIPVHTLAELIAYAHANPGKLNFTSAGIGSPGYLAGELLKRSSGISMEHVPFKGGGEAILSVVSGDVQVMFNGLSSEMAYIKSGQLRPLAVTGARRMPELPDVPTIAESGFPGFEIMAWYGLMVPAGTPSSVVARLHEAASHALASTEVHKRLDPLGFEFIDSTPDAFATYIRTEIIRMEPIVTASGLRIE
jgi:tripartite-type tricarboxylate transporter receptor subunit TctC